MTITTKFNLGDFAIVLMDSNINRLQVVGIKTNHTGRFKIVVYTFLVSKSINFGDPDLTYEAREEVCFTSINELSEYYTDILK